MNPGECTTLLVDVPPTDRARPGRRHDSASPRSRPADPAVAGAEYVWHCHILEHEEHDMMRPLVVQGYVSKRHEPRSPSKPRGSIGPAGLSLAGCAILPLTGWRSVVSMMKTGPSSCCWFSPDWRRVRRGLVGRLALRDGPGRRSSRPQTVLYYSCPMHPAYHSDRAGDCPSCGMRLEPVYAGDDGSQRDDGSTSGARTSVGLVSVDAERQQAIGVQVGQAERKPVVHLIRTSGRVAADETRIYRITAATSGWIEQALPNSVGSLVRQGRARSERFYAREFLSAQQAYFYALDARDRFLAQSAPGRPDGVDERADPAEHGHPARARHDRHADRGAGQDARARLHGGDPGTGRRVHPRAQHLAGPALRLG